MNRSSPDKTIITGFNPQVEFCIKSDMIYNITLNENTTKFLYKSVRYQLTSTLVFYTGN